MSGYIYIAGSFTEVDTSTTNKLDNDPHFWSSPPTWGICRPDIRPSRDINEVIFFVLPKRAKLKQTIFGYLTIKEKITHAQAYDRNELLSKRMTGSNPDGNIIVDERGEYNELDDWTHDKNFEQIKKSYVIGDQNNSRFLSTAEIQRLAPSFMEVLQKVFNNKDSHRPVDLISKKGQKLNDEQVQILLNWINSKPIS
jgi:hypothetical protein